MNFDPVKCSKEARSRGSKWEKITLLHTKPDYEAPGIDYII